jgi:hypothetical protein
MPHMNYALGREQSGDNGLNLALAVDASENFSYFDINSLNIQFYNPAVKRNALSLALSGKVRTAPVLKGNIKISSLVFDKEPLIPMLPEGLQASLGGLPFTKPVVAALGADFTLGTAATVADLDLALAVPDFNVNDLRLLAGITQHNNAAKRIDVRRLQLSSVSRGVTLTAGGHVEMAKAPLSDSDLKLNLRIAYPQMVEVYAPWKLQGAVVLDARMKGDLETGGVSGSLNIKDLYAKNDESKLAVNKVNLAFPFEYSFKTATDLQSRIAIDKSRLIDNEQFRDKVNFTIESVYAKHPARDIAFPYVRDFKSVMFFRNNAFEIVRLEAGVLDGTIFGRDILFNLADLKTDNMEFRLVLDVTNVDINRLDDIEGTQKKTRDAEVSLNADISGKGLDSARG